MPAMLFRHPALPTYWVIRHDDMLYLAPDIPGGWRERRPYGGYKVSLKPVPPNQARIFLDHLGVPNG